MRIQCLHLMQPPIGCLAGQCTWPGQHIPCAHLPLRDENCLAFPFKDDALLSAVASTVSFSGVGDCFILAAIRSGDMRPLCASSSDSLCKGPTKSKSSRTGLWHKACKEEWWQVYATTRGTYRS